MLPKDLREWMGIEPPAISAEKPLVTLSGGAKSGALVLNDPVLVALIEAWPNLPEPIKAAIQALLNSGTSQPR